MPCPHRCTRTNPDTVQHLRCCFATQPASPRSTPGWEPVLGQLKVPLGPEAPCCLRPGPSHLSGLSSCLLVLSLASFFSLLQVGAGEACALPLFGDHLCTFPCASHRASLHLYALLLAERPYTPQQQSPRRHRAPSSVPPLGGRCHGFSPGAAVPILLPPSQLCLPSPSQVPALFSEIFSIFYNF